MSLNVDLLRSLLIAVEKKDYGILKSQLEVDSEELTDLVSRYTILFLSFYSILMWLICFHFRLHILISKLNWKSLFILVFFHNLHNNN